MITFPFVVVFHFRAFAKLYADGDGDRGTHSLYALCTNRCSSPNVPPAEPELRQGYPFCSFTFQ